MSASYSFDLFSTLNARTSILAAANPIGGRYDVSKSAKGNLNISAPILSRFDLLFILLDQNHEDTDRMLAHHIVRVHQRKDQALDPPYNTATLQRYIKAGKALKPQVGYSLLLDSLFSLRLKHKNFWSKSTLP